jgi:hypothetical protein
VIFPVVFSGFFFTPCVVEAILPAAKSTDHLDNAARLSGANDHAIGQHPTKSRLFTPMVATKVDSCPIFGLTL